MCQSRYIVFKLRWSEVSNQLSSSLNSTAPEDRPAFVCALWALQALHPGPTTWSGGESRALLFCQEEDLLQCLDVQGRDWCKNGASAIATRSVGSHTLPVQRGTRGRGFLHQLRQHLLQELKLLVRCKLLSIAWEREVDFRTCCHSCTRAYTRDLPGFKLCTKFWGYWSLHIWGCQGRCGSLQHMRSAFTLGDRVGHGTERSQCLPIAQARKGSFRDLTI